MERDTGIIKERDYIVKTDRSPEEIEEAIKKSEEVTNVNRKNQFL